MIWDTLGIDETTDIKKIKAAYSILAKQYNPEEHPDKFMEIHNAYKEACEYARNNRRFIPENSQEGKIICENNIYAYICDNISRCSINFCSGKIIKTESDDSPCKKEWDFDFSNLKVFSKHKDSNTCTARDEIESVILDDMNKIVTDKDLINSYYIWDNFLSNKIVVDTISNKKNINTIDSIINHRHFIKEIAELISSSIGNGTTIIRNKDFGFYYIDVTGKRKLYYYLTSNRSRKMKMYSNFFYILAFILIILLLIIFKPI